MPRAFWTCMKILEKSIQSEGWGRLSLDTVFVCCVRCRPGKTRHTHKSPTPPYFFTRPTFPQRRFLASTPVSWLVGQWPLSLITGSRSFTLSMIFGEVKKSFFHQQGRISLTYGKIDNERMSVVHQNMGGIGKSPPLEISFDPQDFLWALPLVNLSVCKKSLGKIPPLFWWSTDTFKLSITICLVFSCSL